MKAVARMRNILSGVGRLFDFSLSYNQELQNKYLARPSSEIDRQGLASDWRRIGGDMQRALGRFEQNNAA